jgi:hypothetical protein
MPVRPLLRRQITEAWRQSISTDYAAQRINSERSLQASVWANLNALLPQNTRRTFIEPRMSIPGSNRQSRIPDIVICNSREVIGIVELKYQPRGKPSWNKDLATFHWVTENRDRISISNSRFRGVGIDARSYPLSKTILYVWAGVHAACALDPRSHITPAVSQCFLALHAETQHGQAASIRVTL